MDCVPDFARLVGEVLGDIFGDMGEMPSLKEVAGVTTCGYR